MSVAAPLDRAAGLLEAVGWTAAHDGDLETFRLMLEAANQRMNLVAPASLADFHQRHFLDSVQLLSFAPPRARIWADLGAGAGFPGLVLAIALKGQAGAQVHLVESVAKKCRFLAEVVAALALPATVHNARAETLALTVEVVTARACAPLTRLLGYARPFMDRGARGMFLKGEAAQAEIDEARRDWAFDVVSHVSQSDPRGRILSIGRLHPVRA